MPQCQKCGNQTPEGASYCSNCGTPLETAQQPRLAYWGDRFVAWLLDVIIISVIVTPIRLFAPVAWPSPALAPWLPTWIPFTDFGLNSIIHFLYWLLLEGAYGQSFGKMIMRIKVTGPDGNRASMERIAIESLGKAFLLPLDCILGWILYPRRRQRLFNHLSETIVIKVSRPRI